MQRQTGLQALEIRNWRYRLLLLLACILLILGISGLRGKSRSVQGLPGRFRDEMEAGHYDLAMDMYREVQDKATDINSSEEERETYRGIQLSMESSVSTALNPILDRLTSGSDLRAEEIQFMDGVRELASAQLINMMNKQSEHLLEGSLEPSSWEHCIGQLSLAESLKSYAGDLLAQKAGLFEMIPRVQSAANLEKEADWQDSWSAWQTLSEDSELPRFGREYAAFRLKDYQEREYSRLMQEAENFMEAERYYSASELYGRLSEVFPEREELRARLEACQALLPASVETWEGLLPVLKLRPLVARPELAFPHSGDPGYAANSLISTGEFKAILQTLYSKSYVLVSPRTFTDYPKRRPKVLVPTGKKPVLLVFDRWQYSVLNQICGTTSSLRLDENAQLLPVAGDVEGRDRDAITILEDFIKEHPDFSFDGAKALIALNTDENFLGYVCNERQLSGSTEAWKRCGQQYPLLSPEEMMEQKAEAKSVADYLIRKGWDFASAGEQGLESAGISSEDFQHEIQFWKEDVSDLLQDVSIFCFPNGSHVYADLTRLNELLAAGFHVFIGEGPKPYNFYEDSFVHLDAQTLNANSFQYASSEFREILNGEDILDEKLRGRD